MSSYLTTWRYWLIGDNTPYEWPPHTDLPENVDWTKQAFLQQFVVAIRERAQCPLYRPDVPMLNDIEVGQDLQLASWWNDLFLAVRNLFSAHTRGVVISDEVPAYPQSWNWDWPNAVPYEPELIDEVSDGTLLKPRKWFRAMRDRLDQYNTIYLVQALSGVFNVTRRIKYRFSEETIENYQSPNMWPIAYKMWVYYETPPEWKVEYDLESDASAAMTFENPSRLTVKYWIMSFTDDFLGMYQYFDFYGLGANHMMFPESSGETTDAAITLAALNIVDENVPQINGVQWGQSAIRTLILKPQYTMRTEVYT